MPEKLYASGSKYGTESVEKLVLSVASALVSYREQVAVEARHEEHGTTIVLHVAPSDLEKVIGKQGNTARALRIVLKAAASRLGCHLLLDVRPEATEYVTSGAINDEQSRAENNVSQSS